MTNARTMLDVLATGFVVLMTLACTVDTNVTIAQA